MFNEMLSLGGTKALICSMFADSYGVNVSPHPRPHGQCQAAKQGVAEYGVRKKRTVAQPK